ncbi:hypothetical protein BCR33DRAFT_711005 [Rhizoclosmatium globosum]|uniref:Uncharacterized protein n=1 Tax=Rhizoclosmatium globosum TaxID=329046 RepID=A0A1Y2D2U5_9FUNG|nr:hypothetical protein BCR33DRAFT_711005 [Rhizoclosmatium globosum]|eukprot:ORY53618.1 hypothetical protein BCR33DRAFT_711005 [Rhizoclosmatium globosum]
MDIVIAYYEESLERLNLCIDLFRRDERPKNTLEYIQNTTHADVVVRLPNHGREGHSYFTHIVKYYDSDLGDHTLFMQGIILLHNIGYIMILLQRTLNSGLLVGKGISPCTSTHSIVSNISEKRRATCPLHNHSGGILVVEKVGFLCLTQRRNGHYDQVATFHTYAIYSSLLAGTFHHVTEFKHHGRVSLL